MMNAFHIVSFEGPDPYARAGGIATRVSGLARALSSAGFETHLWFVGDPDLPGHTCCDGVILHRWCQWISRYHPGGVYDGEEGKRLDFSASLPPYLVEQVLTPWLRDTGGHAIILAEEWQTVDAVLHIDWRLRRAGLRDRVTILWNANNTFGFDRIEWSRLAQAAIITTVSRYMRHRMGSLGVDPLVIPNGLSTEALQLAERHAVAAFRHLLAGRVVLSKVARWDPDKRWLLALDIVGDLKRDGLRPLLVARGGVERHGTEVLHKAAADGLRVAERVLREATPEGLISALERLDSADVVSLRSPVPPDVARVLFRASDAVLANSGHEPFGLVGLETMAVGGLACTGTTGEDYAVPGWNALVLQTNDPDEFVTLYRGLHARPADERAIRRHARSTAKQYAWTEVIQNSILPHLRLDEGSTTRPWVGLPRRPRQLGLQSPRAPLSFVPQPSSRDTSTKAA